jgi:Raf kinase inhibitor-like YbhB/YbcL family protein
VKVLQSLSAALALATVATLCATGNGLTQASAPFTLTSSAFKDGDILPTKYAGFDKSRNPPCGGENISPPLQWTNAPAATKSFAIVLSDPEGGNGLGSVHWVAYNIPPTKTSLAEGEASSSPKEWTGGKNNVGHDHYFGPCGPAAHSWHHYVFLVIATDLEPGTLEKGLSREELLAKLRGHALAPAGLVARYKRQN